jgi:hypothetical protein
MDHRDFMTLIRSVYNSLLNCVEGLQTQNQMLLEVLAATGFVATLLPSLLHAQCFDL